MRRHIVYKYVPNFRNNFLPISPFNLKREGGRKIAQNVTDLHAPQKTVTAGTSSYLSVRLSLRMQKKRGSYRTDFRKISFLEFLRKFVDIFHFGGNQKINR